MKRMFSNSWCFPTTFSLWLLVTTTAGAGVVDFQDLSPTTPYERGGAYWNGADGSGDFMSGGVNFANRYEYFADYDYSYWEGWSYSNTTDMTTEGMENQYSAYLRNRDAGQSGSNTYGVYFEPTWFDSPLFEKPTVTLAPGTRVVGAYVTNTTYTALSMLNGDSFSEKFGGSSGNEPDWFKLTISGTDGRGQTTNTVDFYLADYRDPDNKYIVADWTLIDLSSLGDATQLMFHLSSNRANEYGITIPAGFALDDLQIVPEPGTFAILSASLLFLGLQGARAAGHRRAQQRQSS